MTPCPHTWWLPAGCLVVAWWLPLLGALGGTVGHNRSPQVLGTTWGDMAAADREARAARLRERVQHRAAPKASDASGAAVVLGSASAASAFAARQVCGPRFPARQGAGPRGPPSQERRPSL